MSEREAAGRPQRTAAERTADHESIERLADEVLPALVARLAASGLGELEVREDDWRVRIRRPPGERRGPAGGRGAPGRSREEPRHTPETPRPGEPGARRTETTQVTSTAAGGPSPEATAASAGDGGTSDLPPLTAVPIESGDAEDRGPLVATSPAVGIVRLRGDLRTGSRVRAGDRVASVDMLGVPQEVTAPADGILATALVEDGDAVEYGQALIVLEPIAAGGRGA